VNVTRAGTIVENLDVSRTVTISANNVTLRNVRVHGNGGASWGVEITPGTSGVRLQDVEVGGGDNGSTNTGIDVGVLLPDNNGGALSNKAVGVWVHNTIDGFRMDGNSLISCSRVDRLDSSPGAHGDGIQSTGWSGAAVRDSYIEGGANAAIFTSPTGSNPPIVGFEVSRCELVGKTAPGFVTSYPLYINEGTSKAKAVGNVFGGTFEQRVPAPDGAAFSVWSDNHWSDGSVAPRP